MKKKNELEFESDKVKAYVQQIQAINSLLSQANEENNELLIKLGYPTKTTAKRKVLCLQQQLDQLKAENEELKRQHQSNKGLITTGGKLNYQLIQEVDKLKAENDNLFNAYNSEVHKIVQLKQTLQEIKEIAEAITNGTHFSDDVEEHLKKMVNKILGKINEIEECL